MDILDLDLQTHRLADQRAFYGEVLRLPFLGQTAEAIAFQAGATRLVFSSAPAGVTPEYHVAFIVPRGKLPLAKAWLAGRADLLTRDGADEIELPSWNARAVYNSATGPATSSSSSRAATSPTMRRGPSPRATCAG